jgi:hypothetical protein
MAENKTKPTKTNVAAFVGVIADAAKRAEANAVIKMMRDATGEKPVLWGPSIIGFGRYRYCYDSGRTGEMPIVAYSPRKAAHVIYIIPGFPSYKDLLAKLGPHTSGKSCLYIKRLSEIDRRVLEMLVNASVADMRAKYDAASKTQGSDKDAG